MSDAPRPAAVLWKDFLPENHFVEIYPCCFMNRF